MTAAEARALLDAQRAYFKSGATLPVSARKKALKALYESLGKFEDRIYDAIHTDLGKSRSEAAMCEVGLTRSEISYMLKHVARYAREKRVMTPMTNWVSRSFIKPSPYGNVLIMSPWNYPLLLSLEPLVDAIAAGNTAIVKPSAYAPESAKVIADIIADCFPPEYVTVVNGGREENRCLLDLDFDYIFFTGGKNVGKEVLRHAAERLTPVTLELGGKSPCIVDASANIRLAARRIVFGKIINCGQTCVAPDYILCDASVKDKLIEEIKREIARQCGSDPLASADYGKIINKKHFDRISGLMDNTKIVHGGRRDEAALKIEPTIMDNVTWDDSIMQEEIFGPIFPILTFDRFESVFDHVAHFPTPLALYFFSSDKAHIEAVKSRISYGGGCINDTIVHLATSNMGFGGVGTSGMGAYHGKVGFDTFSHKKSMVDKKTWIDVPLRYRPYKKLFDKVIRFCQR